MRIVITRPIKKALCTKEKIKKMGHIPIMMPLSYFSYNKEEVFHAIQGESYGGIAITSSEALCTLPIDFCHHKPIFAVGKASAYLAKQKGFSKIFYGQDNSIGLANIIIQQKKMFAPKKPLIYLGRKPRNLEFENYLIQHNIPFKIIECYISRRMYYPEVTLKNLLQNADSILFYSRSAVSYFFSLPLPEKISANFLCLSKNIAFAIPPSYKNVTIVADFPKEKSLLNIILPKNK
ncbi:uroporphyrinogen-III synthase [Candidatus Liberibacter brunswickensis]|uniref:uroporphyrinogen-III synthase n=1 Tax=Candidatus Liberibacter brunswickensis TaxID=1968796 RepID=UPI002FE2634F